jgi:hypothetical protein
MIHNTPNTPLLDDSNNNHQKPLILKPCNQTQESKSSYFPYKTFINTDSSNDSVPNTSLIATPSVTVTNSVTASSKYGYESDSSEEGRNTSHQRLGLRVTNPDVRDDLSVEITPQTTTVTKLEPGEVEITNDIVSESSKIAIINDIKGEEQLSPSVQVTPHVLTALPVTRSSEDWKLYENRKPDISLPDQQQVKRLIRCDPPLQRRVSKTLAVPDEIVHNKDPKEVNTHDDDLY